jgi:hypothetical protein
MTSGDWNGKADEKNVWLSDAMAESFEPRAKFFKLTALRP